MYIPVEFVDYLTTAPSLTSGEQEARFELMHAAEIKRRAEIYLSLGYEKGIAKLRIKENFRWSFEPFVLAPFDRMVDSIVDEIYSTRA